jgi:hypothetical protein
MSAKRNVRVEDSCILPVLVAGNVNHELYLAVKTRRLLILVKAELYLSHHNPNDERENPHDCSRGISNDAWRRLSGYFTIWLMLGFGIFKDRCES